MYGNLGEWIRGDRRREMGGEGRGGERRVVR